MKIISIDQIAITAPDIWTGRRGMYWESDVFLIMLEVTRSIRTTLHPSVIHHRPRLIRVK